ncbi:hypothetical protein LSTR_LSTR012276 [Laodelphax striatellus]|uniref:Uncharacterized protein n=1 Tax=Laodelphax striatellus TaxID=195883 RepID=A0A482WLN4_LAOST|nr:hypothetical protein LSTR_LSTR012276 [Laodelphax striatellus]
MTLCNCATSFNKMLFGSYEKLFRDSATKMMLSSLIILISISISIGLPARTLNIADEIQHQNCSLTNKYFLEQLKLNETCADSYVADDSQIGEETSMSLELCMAFLELNNDFCKLDTSSKHYRSGFYDESTNFVIHNISQYNATQVDDFLQGLNKRVKNVGSFYKYLNNSRKQLEPYKWATKFFGRIHSVSDSEILCGDSNNIKQHCSVLLWARTLKEDQTAMENNNSNIDNKQQSSTESLKSPSRTAEEEMALNESANHVAAAAAPAHSKVLPQPPSVISHSPTDGSPVPPSDDSNNNADLAKKPSSTADVAKKPSTALSNANSRDGEIDSVKSNVNENGNMEGNVNGNEDGNRNGNEEVVKDNRYESVVDEGRADELKSNANEEVKKEEGKVKNKVAAGFEENEPPAGIEGEQPQQSHIMSVKDRNEEVSGQLASDFNEQQPQLTVADADKQAAANDDEFGDGPAEEDPGSAVRVSSGVEQMSVIARGNMDPIGSDESHFYSYFISMGAIIVLLYLMLHYKKKLLALAVEGRRGRAHGSGRRRPNTASYSKLDSNLEEAMASNMSQASVTS